MTAWLPNTHTLVQASHTPLLLPSPQHKLAAAAPTADNPENTTKSPKSKHKAQEKEGMNEQWSAKAEELGKRFVELQFV